MPKYSGPSIITPRQVGPEVDVVVFDNNKLVTTQIKETESRKDGAGAVSIYYKVAALPDKWFPAAEVFTDETAAKDSL